ncbi:site-specific integrase [Ruegeria sp. HKCCA5426]|uniref:tyrosine-type recombinase/integrase n=1 Tax=Ruegeria sp. HKCCA5426 TaxID=2682985 RepID=UPI0014878EED|nr:site-specific integrase [Ruegeria sp. HKCCA5426]
MGERITDKLVKSLEAPKKGNVVTYDSEVIGFGVRVTAKGAKAFVLRYVFPDENSDIARKTSEYRFTIGSYPTWSVSAAREEAKEWRRKIDRGESHPLAQRQDKRSKAKARREAETFREAVEDYIKREQIGRKKNVTAPEVRRRLLTDAPQWLDIPVAEITAEDVWNHLEFIRDGDPYASPAIRERPYLANRLFSYLRTFFKWCSMPGIKKISESVMVGMNPPWDNEEPRDRFFDDKELLSLWEASDAIGSIQGAYLKTAILTGKRRSALASMRWNEIDKDWLWTPPKRPKSKKDNKRLHAIPLPKILVDTLSQLRPKEGAATGNPFVFPGKKRGSKFYPGSKFQNLVKEASGIDDFFLHALRHTAETRMAELGVQPHIRDILLDHASKRGSGEDYDHYHYRKEMLEALELWAAHIQSLVKNR